MLIAFHHFSTLFCSSVTLAAFLHCNIPLSLILSTRTTYNIKYDIQIFEYIVNAEEALKIRKLIHGEQHEAVATVLQELGDLMDDLGEYETAMSFYIDALDIRRSRLGLDDIAVAETLYRYDSVSAQKELATRMCSL